MRRGHEVYLKYKFRITSYDLNTESLVIEVLREDEPNEILILPIYLGELGIYPLSIAFVTPGDHLPVTHPDYYQVLSTKNGYRVSYQGVGYQLRFKSNFNLTGKYMLVDDFGQTVHRTATKKKLADIQNDLENSINEVLDGNLIHGKFICAIFREHSTQKISNIADYVDEDKLFIFQRTDVTAIIQDIHTTVEFEIPLHLIASK